LSHQKIELNLKITSAYRIFAALYKVISCLKIIKQQLRVREKSAFEGA